MNDDHIAREMQENVRRILEAENDEAAMYVRERIREQIIQQEIDNETEEQK